MNRAFRSLRNALDILEQFETRGIELRCLTKPIDTTTSAGKCFYQIHNSFTELERNFIRERTIAEMQAVKKRGAEIGSPRKQGKQQIIIANKRMSADPQLTTLHIAKQLVVTPSTLLRSMKRYQQGGNISNQGCSMLK